VAAQADRQLRVSKRTARDAIRTTVQALDAAERIDEVARMLGGTEITARTRAHAREMLESAAQSPPGETRPASGGAGSSRGRSGRAKSASGR